MTQSCGFWVLGFGLWVVFGKDKRVV